MGFNNATQKDVATKAGVSQATVSIALNPFSEFNIPAHTIERIQKAAKELNYKPNRFAKALRTNRTQTLACIIPDITNPFYPALVKGVQRACELEDYDLVTLNTDGSKDKELHYIELAKQGRYDGIIGVFFNLGSSHFEELAEQNIPVVRLESNARAQAKQSFDNIYVDDHTAFEEITQLLIDTGHQDICMISGKGGPQHLRVSGYKKALANARIQPFVQLEEEFTENGGEIALEKLLIKRPMPSAIVAANDLMAIGCMRVIKNLGLSIPDQIAVTGFDNIPAAELVTPSLTTIDRFQENSAEKAAKIIIGRLNKQIIGQGQTIKQPYKIIRRNSA